MRTRRSSNIYTDIPKNKFVENLPNFIIPKLWNKWMVKLDVYKTKHSIKVQMKTLLVNKYLDSVKCTNKYCRQCYPIG